MRDVMFTACRAPIFSVIPLCDPGRLEGAWDQTGHPAQIKPQLQQNDLSSAQLHRADARPSQDQPRRRHAIRSASRKFPRHDIYRFSSVLDQIDLAVLHRKENGSPTPGAFNRSAQHLLIFVG